MSDRGKSDDDIAREASIWSARMHGENAESWQTEFNAWLQGGPAYVKAYNEGEEIYIVSERAQRMHPEDTSGHSAPPLNTGPDREPKRVSRPLIVGALGVLLLGSVAYVGTELNWKVMLHGETDTGSPAMLGDHAVLATRDNEERRCVLSDGSVVLLRPNSRLAIAFDRTERRLFLKQGSARFEVAHENRSFIVAASGGSVIARGTIFDVTIGADHKVHVNLTRGAVDVVSPGNETGHAPAIKKLKPGEHASYAAQEPAPEISLDAGSTISQATTAPRVGTVPAAIDQPQTVGELVTAVNQAADSSVKLLVLDSSILTTPLSGHFTSRDPETIAERLSFLLGLTVDRSRPGILALRQNNTPP
ncbi:FecR family protein [Sphingobium yanoikuyae]|uniref:FecR family protein n=1 Tax=Sphingobium yanoikuyae TaxID=13690 RepID=UPI0004E3AF7B|nr:FecR domain-containing protein [Sphingobium yanoikuyae]KFD26681.1 hypothetical protein IH86_18715 [Sphingobium yanoikuyae]MDV3482003.1 FecR domain-containing protein [Sphingobium yanoikuyae]